METHLLSAVFFKGALSRILTVFEKPKFTFVSKET